MILRTQDRGEAEDVHLTVISPRGPAGRLFTLTRWRELLDFVDGGVGPGR